ncbi:MAG: hypothetical protein ACPKQO_11095 [Nitrososphaeraceae archaeon]
MKENATLQHQSNQSNMKLIIFDMMIDIAEEGFNIPIIKKLSSVQLIDTRKNKMKR